ncbi:MAG: hypothetical protein CM15mL4_0270 [uncultured marine virus]|nr:MAG: hypothetical protein CM15mL4_0270 [uncultured marine virus]
MQKIINGIAIFSGAVALGVVGLGGYVFIRKDAIIDNVKSKIMESVLPGGIGGALGGGALGGLDIPEIGSTYGTRSSTYRPNFTIRFLEKLIF